MFKFWRTTTKLTKGEAKILLEAVMDSRGQTKIVDTPVGWILDDDKAAELQEIADRYREAVKQVDVAVDAFKAKEGSGSAIFTAYPPAFEALLELSQAIRSLTGKW